MDLQRTVSWNVFQALKLKIQLKIICHKGCKMHIKIKVLLLISIMLITSALLSGAYLRYQPVQLSQPDGTELDLYASGDEYYNWLHDKEGYTVKQNEQGWYVYLVNTANKELAFTDYIVGKADPAGLNLIPWANIAPEKIGEIRQKAQRHLREIGNGRAPSSGTLNNISIFIRFSDQTEFGQNIFTYSSMFNGTTGNTLQSYYLEASYNTLNIPTTFYPTSQTTVVSWQDSHPRAYYSPYSSTNTIGFNGDTERRDREFTLLVDAVNGVRSQIPSNLIVDSDNDGKVDNICFIIKGGTDGWAELLWPHRWSLYNQYVYINNKRVYDFNFQLSESLASSGVGVLCHEMFHSLGAPDLYHYTSNGITPVGAWDLMEHNSNPPQHMSAYMKYKYGHWIPSIPTLSTSGTYSLNPLTSSTGQCYRIDSPSSSSEYFVVEFRKKTGTFESSVPGSGMVIYRINPAVHGNADGPPDEVYVFRPGGSPTANGSVSSAFLSTQAGRTSFNNTSNPYGFFSDGSLGDIALSLIGSSAGNTISFTYNASNAPLELTAVSSAGSVILNWEAPLIGTPLNYKIYRNGALAGSSSTLRYIDTSVSVGSTYNYYVTARFPSPAPESGPSIAVSITVTDQISAVLGSGTESTVTNAASPINVWYQSLHGQSVYTRAELNAQGVAGPTTISQIGFNVTGLPANAMPNYIVRMGHTSASNAGSWTPSIRLSTVWTSASYQPTQTGWNMLTLSTPFLWNGTDNIVIDTAFGLIGRYNSSGTIQYTSYSNGYRFGRSDLDNQTNVFTGGSTAVYRPNLKLIMLPPPSGPLIVVNPLNFAYGTVALGSSSVRQFTIQNDGDQTLTGSITTPTGYTVAGADTRPEEPGLSLRQDSRNTLSFSIAAGASKTYNLSFAPTAAIAHNGNVMISSNAADYPTVDLSVTGTGYVPPTINIDSYALYANIELGNAAADSFTINNSGDRMLNYQISLAELDSHAGQILCSEAKSERSISGNTSPNPSLAQTNRTLDWFSAEPLTGNIPAGQSHVITGYFMAQDMAPGSYAAALSIQSNDPNNPSCVVNVTMDVWEQINNPPSIVLPSTFSFEQNTSLTVDFSPYVEDVDTDELSLSCSGATNISVLIDSLSVTFGAPSDWCGTEILTFTVSDGELSDSSEVNVSVILTHLDAPIISSILKTPAGIEIQWLPVPNALFYRIYRSFTPYGEYPVFLGSTQQTVFVDTGLGNYPEVFYKIVSTDEQEVSK